MKSRLREQYVAFLKKFDAAMVKGDAAAAARLFTEDAGFVDPTAGPIHGRKAMKKFFAVGFQQIPFISHVSTPDQHSPHIIGTTGKDMDLRAMECDSSRTGRRACADKRLLVGCHCS